jgi:dihydroxyacid dehydratase/phosphogluconate dehydratase
MLNKPVIGIAYTGSDFNNCHRHFPELLSAVKRGVLAACALPLEFPTISLGEVFLTPTSLKYRNLMAMDTEEMIRAQPMDAVVLMGGCDKTVPAQLMGAVSADRPAIMLVAGPMKRRQSRRAARRLHRLPPLLGALSCRRNRRRRDLRCRRSACRDRRHLRGDGHGFDHGLSDRGARNVSAGNRRDPCRAC